ncbi:MAG: DivIVA domain-containing protein, partial [Acidimicrobiales bacterium]
MDDDRLFSGPGREVLSPDLVSQFGFTVARRGYDQAEVRQFLRRVSDELLSLRSEMDQANQARRAAEERANHPALDEEALMAAVGQETATILRSARRAAHDMSERANVEAARLVDEAQVAAGELRARAEAVLAEASAEAEKAAEHILLAARLEATDLVTRAAEEAQATRDEAEREGKSIIEGAQVARDTILTDLSRRRRVAAIQIEQLRAGRERLLESYSVVRRTLDEVHDELARADDDARAAADEAGRRAEQRSALADAGVLASRAWQA